MLDAASPTRGLAAPSLQRPRQRHQQRMRLVLRRLLLAFHWPLALGASVLLLHLSPAAATEEDGSVNLLQQILLPRLGDGAMEALPTKLVQKAQASPQQTDTAQVELAKRRSDILSLAEDTASSLRESAQVQRESHQLELEALIEQEKTEEAQQQLQSLHSKRVKLQRSLVVVEASLHNAEKRNKALLIAALGAAACVGLVAIIGCACAAWSKPRRDSEGNLRAPLAKRGSRQGRLGALGNDLSERLDDSLQSCRRWLCGCSPKVALASWSFALLWVAAIALLWKLGVIQPYLKNILLYGYFLFGVGSLVFILIWEYVHRLKNVFRRGYKTVMGFHDKIDDALESIGLHNLEQGMDASDAAANASQLGSGGSSTGAAAARASAFTLDGAFGAGDADDGTGTRTGTGAPAVGRTVKEAAARSADRKARNATRKPQPGSPAWALAAMRKGSGCC